MAHPAHTINDCPVLGCSACEQLARHKQPREVVIPAIYLAADLARAREQGFNEAREMAAGICAEEYTTGIAMERIRAMQPAKKEG